MTISIHNTNFNIVKTQDFPSWKNKIQLVNVSYYNNLGDRKYRRSLGLYSKIGPNVDVINGKNINGVSAGEVSYSYIGLKKAEVTNNDDQSGEAQAHMLGKFLEGHFVYSQTFIIRSYEIGPDKTATMETLMNLLQETALNHVTSSGIAGNGFGATREMSLKKLIWVVTRVHVQVSKYSSWGDVVEIDTWVDAAGKNGMRRDWIIRDHSTKNVITRATSTWVTMNKETRKLSKIPEEVRHEVEPFYLNRYALEKGKDDPYKIIRLTDESADFIQPGLAPRWNDMDANQHVNNVKYIGWILESVPLNVLQDYNMTSMTLEYRRECRQSNILESLTTMKKTYRLADREELENTHLLRMQDNKGEIVRARTKWLPKSC